MARINIEDNFWVDIIDLAVKFGSQDTAIGMAIRFFKFAQEKYKNGNPISEDEFKSKGFSEHLFPVFARREKDGIYAVGSKKHFGWLRTRAESGKRGGEKNAGRLSKNNDLPQSKTKQTEASYSYSSSSSNSSSCSPSSSKEKNNTFQPDKSLNAQIWQTYREAYVARYKIEPARNAMVNAQISQLAKRLGGEAIEIVKFYLSHPDSFYISKTHSIGYCLKDAESLRTQYLRNTKITKATVRSFEQSQQNADLINRIRTEGI